MNRDTVRKTLATYFERPITQLLAALGITPHMVTLSGLLLAGASAYLVSQGLLLAGGLVLAGSGLFDLLDGALARATGKTSQFGALLDSVSDRIGEAGLLVGVLIFYSATENTAGMALAFAAFASSIMVSYVRARGEGLGIDCQAGIMTRPERVSTLVVALVVAQWWTPILVIALATISGLAVLTSFQRLLIIRSKLSRTDN